MNEGQVERRTARRYGLAGIGLFGSPWFLGGIGEVVGLAWLVPFADTSLSLGFVIALLGAFVAGSSIWPVLPIEWSRALATSTKGQDHAVHILSELGFGFSYTAHIILGLVLIGVATVAASVLSYYHTRSDR